VQEPDREWLFVDGSYVRAHQHSSGAATADDEAIAKSRGGNTTKIHLSVDTFGYLVAFEITAGNINDSPAVPCFWLIHRMPRLLLLTKATIVRRYVSWLWKGGKPVIPHKKNSRKGNDDLDRHLYQLRHLVENAFLRLKHFRGVATRYDKLKRNFISVVALACLFVWLPI